MIKKYSFLSFASILLLLLIFASCRSAKYLDDDQALVVDVDINGLSGDLKEKAAAYVSTELRPNSELNLFIYNLFNTKKGKYKSSKIRNVGEAPHVLDSSLVDLSSQQITRFLQSKGYFQAQVQSSIQLSKKKARIDFDAAIGDPYVINAITYRAEDKAIEALYASEVRAQSGLQPGKRYDAADLLAEREMLYFKLKEKGYYDYLRQYMRVAVDSNQVGAKANLAFTIQNPTDSSAHKIYTIDSVFVHIVNPDGRAAAKNWRTQRYPKSGVIYSDETTRFRLRPLMRYIYTKPGERYNIRKENLSYDRLFEMNGFRSVKIEHEKVDSNQLNIHYNLIARPVMGNQIEGEYTFSSGMSGFNIANTFSHRNIFGGAEHLEVKLRYGILFDPRIAGSLGNKIFNNDIQIGVNLVIPRLMTPFGIHSVGTYGLPKTTISSNLQLFQQDNTYSNRYFTNSINYAWFSSAQSMHSFTPISLEYKLGRLDDNFANQLIDEGYLLYVRSNNRAYFGLGTQYTYTYNAPKLLKLADFAYLRTSVEFSGNALSLANQLFKFPENDYGENMLFQVPYLQYAKAEFDFRMYRYLGGHRQFVMRFNGGVAVPYGNNSSLLIFEKSFYGGGMNGIRAWQARTLGPGSYSRSALSESLRLNLRNLDQLGEVKLEMNAELRFRIFNKFLGAKLNGATFIDAGNVWRLKENELNPGGEFKADKFLSQIAIGTGFGLRLDMDYFLIRLDAGLKVKDPQFTGSNQWVIKDFFRPGTFKDTYYNSHKPDRYSFIQYNFSVGLPF